ncbi:hypothetical protein [Morganella morganii IS15]|nr:hypothetical protein CSB69_0402 [Morganella morganii]EMP51032.1 hypothetical protein C790_01721 [Morganella morganii SC01]CDK63545.1 hypothetical protein [Morganella morganii IS15]
MGGSGHPFFYHRVILSKKVETDYRFRGKTTGFSAAVTCH